MRYPIVPVFAVLIIAIALAAGCTSVPSGSTAAGTAQNPAASGTSVLDRTETAVLTNGTYAVNATIDSISVEKTDAGGHRVDIYIRAGNAGTAPVQLRWYSRLTTANGDTFGGVGISHGGDGAETAILRPGESDEARDYVNIDTDTEYAEFSERATLEVFITTEPLEGETPVGFTAAWDLPAAVFT